MNNDAELLPPLSPLGSRSLLRPVMTLPGLLVTMLLCCLFSRYNGVEGRSTQKQLNKPALKTVRDDYGNLYDCVDFYKQPAFNHPLLKNNTYSHDTKPQFGNEKMSEISLEAKKTLPFVLKESCLVGTVPIKRKTKEHLKREKRALQEIDFGGSLVAVAQTRTSDKLTGAVGHISNYNPLPGLSQSTAARIHFQNGNDFIQFGWRVDPLLYEDNRTHYFIRTNTPSANCFDLGCGFVLISPDYSPGYTIAVKDLSVRYKRQFDTKLTVRKGKDGDWWLLAGDKDIPLGFWPRKLFNELSDVATYVSWGGDVTSPHFVPGPPMGNGFFPDTGGSDDPSFAYAYIHDISVFDSLGNEIDPKTEAFTDDKHGHYGVVDTSDPTYNELQHFILFGGNSV